MFRVGVDEDYLSADTMHIRMGLAEDLRLMCETLGYFRRESNAYGQDVYIKTLG